MKMNPTTLFPAGPQPHHAGGIKKMALIFLGLAGLLWLGVPTGREIMKIHDGKRCRENLVYIAKGKQAYIEDRAIRAPNSPPPPNPQRYMDIIPYMPLKNIPECPCGKPYLHVLELSKEAECQVNGDTVYEPITPGTDLSQNGFHDRYPQAEYLGALRIPLQMLGIKPKEKSPFEDTPRPE